MARRTESVEGSYISGSIFNAIRDLHKFKALSNRKLSAKVLFAENLETPCHHLQFLKGFLYDVLLSRDSKIYRTPSAEVRLNACSGLGEIVGHTETEGDRYGSKKNQVLFFHLLIYLQHDYFSYQKS